MNLEDFQKDFLTTVRVAADAAQDFVHARFVIEAGNRLSDAEEVSDIQICQFEGLGSRRRRLQVDAYSVDEADGSINLIIADFNNENDLQPFGATDVRRLFSSVKAFVEDSLEGTLTDGSIDEGHPAVGLAMDLRRLQSSVVRFRIYVVSDRLLSTRVTEWPEDEIQGIPVEYHIWDVARFHRAHESSSGRDALEVDFRGNGFNGLPCLAAGSALGEYEAFLCMIPGPVLADVYNHFGSRLLEGNVRSFLSTKGKVNSGIQDTIESKPEMFFAYNNGIAATAEAVEIDTSNGLHIVRATNLQIVNGGQTTASVAFASRNGADLSRVCVQMKLSVLPSSKAGELTPLIAKFANSQNKVSDADFFANHPYHVRLEEISRRVWTPVPPGSQYGSHWFYERARGQYSNAQSGMTKGEKATFLIQNPKPQLLTKTDIAKLENTWRGLPHKVSLGAQKNFIVFAEWAAKEWSQDNIQFNDDYYRYLVSLAILFKHTEGLVSKQTWYQGGYRANVVTYTLAKLQYMVLKDAKGSQLDLREIWELQSVPHELSEQLKIITTAVFKVLTAPGRPKENVTEWAKMPGCWTKVQEKPVELNFDLLVQKRDPKLESALSDVSRGIQPVGFGLFARASVMNVQGIEWEDMLRWGAQQGMLSTKEQDLLRAASRIPRFVPTAKDCEKILKIKAKLEAHGFDVIADK